MSFCPIRHAHYESGITPLTLVWKDEACSQYVLDTDSEGHVPAEQHVGSFICYVCLYHSRLNNCLLNMKNIINSCACLDPLHPLIILTGHVLSYVIRLCWSCKRMESLLLLMTLQLYLVAWTTNLYRRYCLKHSLDFHIIEVIIMQDLFPSLLAARV